MKITEHRQYPRVKSIAQVFGGALLGLGFYFATIPHQCLVHGSCGFTVFEDQLITITSLRYFVWDQWRWPLFLASGLGSGQGTVIVLTDSIPIYALALRLFRFLITPNFNFIGFWIGICYALQGAGSSVSLRLAGVRHWVPITAGAVLVLSYPPWIQRLGHSALSFQTVVILAVGVYLATARLRHASPVVFVGLPLAWITCWVNAYLLVMVSGIVVAAIVLLWRDRVMSFRRTASTAIVLIAVTIAMMITAGYFAPKGPGRGFGVFSMNLLSPITPQLSGVFGSVFPNIDATGGQYEGFSYFGAGLLLLIVVAGCSLVGRYRSLIRRHWALVATLIGFTAVALSTKVYLGQRLLVDLGSPPEMIAMFRSSGRFFWAPAYVIALSSIVVVARMERRWAAYSTLVLAAALQLWDATPMRQSVTNVLKRPSLIKTSEEAWADLLAEHEGVEVQPIYECVDSLNQQWAASEIMYHTSRSRTPINTVYLPRPEPKRCDEIIQNAVSHRVVAEGQLLVLLRGTRRIDNYAVLQSGIVDGHRICRPFLLGQLCSSSVDWSDFERTHGDLIDTGPDDMPRLQVGKSLWFNTTSLSTSGLLSGWHPPDDVGAWTNGQQGLVVLRPSIEGTPEQLQLIIVGNLLPFRQGGWDRTLTVYCGDKILRSQTFPPESSQVELRVALDPHLISNDEPSTLRFEIDHPPSADEALQNGDPRIFGFRLSSLELEVTSQ